MKNPLKKNKKIEQDDNEYWTGLRDLVDKVFEQEKDVRKEMDENMRQFREGLWDKSKLDSTKSQAMTNFLFSTVQSIAPMLTDTKPDAKVIPREPEYAVLADMYTKGLSYNWDVLELQDKLNTAVIYAMVKKAAIFELSYNPNKRFGGDLDLHVIDPVNFFIMPGYEDEWDAPMMGVREMRPISWVKDNFPHIEEVVPSGFLTSDADSEEEKRRAIRFGNATDYEMESYFVRVYRVWVRDTQTMAESISTEDDKDLKKLDKAYPYGKWVYFTNDQFLEIRPCRDEHNLPPFVKLINYVDPGNFLGIDENKNIEGLNKEFNLQYQYMVDHSRQYHDESYEVDTERLDPDEVKQNIKFGGKVYPTDKLSQEGPAIRLIERRPLDGSVKDLVMITPNLIQEVTGVTEISKGEAAKKERQSASEIGILIEASHTRTRQRIRNLEHTIKRLAYLIVRMMMQYYDETRTIKTKDDEDIVYTKIGNTRAMAEELIRPLDTVLEKFAQSDDPKRDLPPDQVTAVEDFMKILGGEGKDTDPVYFDFDIEIQTESTLPMDKQTRANQAFKLYAAKAIDRRALLEILQWPNIDAIISRIDEEAAKMKAAKAGG